MLTFIDGEPLKAGLLLRGSTVQWEPDLTTLKGLGIFGR